MISFLIPFASEEPHRIESFQFNVKHLKKTWASEENTEFIGGAIGEDGIFNRSASRNVAAAMAKGDVFVFVDADSIVDPEMLQSCLIALRQSQWAFPYSRYVALTEEGSHQFMHHPETSLVPEDVMHIFPSIETPAASVGGCVIVTRQAFELVGGYDERFIGWGFEDRAFAASLDTLIGPAYEAPGDIIHLWHPAPEEDCFGQPHLRDNQELWFRYRDAGTKSAMVELIKERQ